MELKHDGNLRRLFSAYGQTLRAVLKRRHGNLVKAMQVAGIPRMNLPRRQDKVKLEDVLNQVQM